MALSNILSLLVLVLFSGLVSGSFVFGSHEPKFSLQGTTSQHARYLVSSYYLESPLGCWGTSQSTLLAFGGCGRISASSSFNLTSYQITTNGTLTVFRKEFASGDCSGKSSPRNVTVPNNDCFDDNGSPYISTVTDSLPLFSDNSLIQS